MVIAALCVITFPELPTQAQTFSRWSPLCDGVDHTAGIALGDLDGDGDLDAVFATGRHLAEKDWVFSNDGHGGFYGKRALGDAADPSYGVALGDLDGDGDLDAIIANDIGARSVVYRNDGRGHFTSLAGLGATGHPRRAVALGDFDKDGDLDIVLVGMSQDHLYFNDGAGRRWTERALGSREGNVARATGVAVADLDADNDLDIVIPGRYEGDSLVYMNDGKGNFGETRQFGLGPDDPTSVAVGDVDGDGDPDIVTANWEQLHVVYVNDGRGRFSKSGTFGTGNEQAWAIVLGDIDLDGDLDAIVGNANVNYWNDDLDGDGRPDRFGQEARGISSRLYVNNGRGQFIASVSFGTGNDNTRPIAVGDIDRDGDLDVVMGNDCQPNYVFFNSIRAISQKPR
jgi:hypothetical protein